MSRTSIILLTLNEVTGVSAMLDRLPTDHVEEVLAVDGGSSDGTVEVLRQRGIPVVLQDRPGRGAAFVAGASATYGDHLVFFSPDGNEDPEDIARLLAKLDEGFDLAIASRFMKGAFNEEDVSWWRPRAWANRAFSAVANWLFARPGTRVTDTINGFRAIRRSAFERLQLSEPGFPIEYQMSIRAMKLGLRIAEIPTREGQRLGGVSKARSIPVGLGHLKVLIQELGTFADRGDDDAG